MVSAFQRTHHRRVMAVLLLVWGRLPLCFFFQSRRFTSSFCGVCICPKAGNMVSCPVVSSSHCCRYRWAEVGQNDPRLFGPCPAFMSSAMQASPPSLCPAQRKTGSRSHKFQPVATLGHAEAAPRPHARGETGLRETAARKVMLQAVTRHTKGTQHHWQPLAASRSQGGHN